MHTKWLKNILIDKINNSVKKKKNDKVIVLKQ